MRPVLIIEDDSASRETYAMLIRSALGYDVVTAEGGAPALELLRQGLRPGIIVLDLAMPDMDGFAFRAQQLADTTLACCPVLVCSANIDDFNNLERLKATAYLQKPIEPEAFLRLVKALHHA
jgi:CheY-like chemotaxis protein